MAGHSKWANIKHRKGKADALKGKLFTRISKEIINAVKLGGKDPKANPRLKLALQKAKDANIPNDNVERAINKALSLDQEEYHEMQYELYGFGGVGIVLDVLTSNKNRIASEIRIATNKRGGTIAHPGSVGFNFDRKGVIHVFKKKAREDELFKAVLNAGADDFTSDEDSFLITCDPADLQNVKDSILKLGIEIDEAAIEMIPKNYMNSDIETARKNLALIEFLESIDDIDAVYHNMKIPDDLLEESR